MKVVLYNGTYFVDGFSHIGISVGNASNATIFSKITKESVESVESLEYLGSWMIISNRFRCFHLPSYLTLTIYIM